MSGTLMSKLAFFRELPCKWLKRSRSERTLLLEAVLLLAIARMAVIIIPFRRLAPSLGDQTISAGEVIRPGKLHIAQDAGQAVRSAASHTFWISNCLPQALAGYWMLKRRRIPATLFLGVAKEAGKANISAHAWLRCGDMILTGAEGHEQFTVITAFS